MNWLHHLVFFHKTVAELYCGNTCIVLRNCEFVWFQMKRFCGRVQMTCTHRCLGISVLKIFVDILLNALHYKPVFLGETCSDCYTFIFNEETAVQNLFVSQFAVDFERTRTLQNRLLHLLHQILRDFFLIQVLVIIKNHKGLKKIISIL